MTMYTLLYIIMLDAAQSIQLKVSLGIAVILRSLYRQINQNLGCVLNQVCRNVNNQSVCCDPELSHVTHMLFADQKRRPVPGSVSYQRESNTLAVCCKVCNIIL